MGNISTQTLMQIKSLVVGCSITFKSCQLRLKLSFKRCFKWMSQNLGKMVPLSQQPEKQKHGLHWNLATLHNKDILSKFFFFFKLIEVLIIRPFGSKCQLCFSLTHKSLFCSAPSIVPCKNAISVYLNAIVNCSDWFGFRSKQEIKVWLTFPNKHLLYLKKNTEYRRTVK